MTLSRLSLLALTGSLMFAPAVAQAEDSFWKGTWVGKWGGDVPTTIVITNTRVKKYTYAGESYPVGDSKVAKTVRFGTDFYAIFIRKTGKNSAFATYEDDEGDHGTVDLTRR